MKDVAQVKNNKKISLKNVKNTFDKISSNHAQDWQLALFWIVLFELFASMFEYFFVEKSHAYVQFVPNNFFNEIYIALIVVMFIWFCVYNLVFMNKTNLLYLALYAVLCIYLFVTQDVTFNLIAHNLNPLELNLGGGFYFTIQLFFKLLITYLIFQLVIAYRHKRL